MSENDEVDRMIMTSMGAFTRKVSNTWINPAKSRAYYEDMRRIFCKDESPEGLYPACVVTDNLLGEVVVITPLLKFNKLLELWKKANPKYVKRLKKWLSRRTKEGT